MRLLAAFVASIVLFLGWGFFDIARRHWLLDVELADGVWVVQTPFEHAYAIRTANSSVVPDPFGWVIRSNCIYGSYGEISCFFIRLGDLKTTRPRSLGELNEMLRARGLPRYPMNDEENPSYLKYGRGRYRKYR